VDLRFTVGYSWAAATLSYMYEQLGYASFITTKQLARNAILLHVS